MNKTMKSAIGLFVVPFLLFSQNILPTATGNTSNDYRLLACVQDSLKNDRLLAATVDEEPIVARRVDPKYPTSMLNGRWEADVYLKALVNENGDVTDIQTQQKKVLPYRGKERQTSEVQIPDGKEFENAATAAARQWKFTPAQKAGKSIAAWVTIPFRFRISASDEDLSQDTSARGEYERVFRSTRTIVDNVLKGNNIEEVIRQHINPDAYLIFENKYVSLYGVLKKEEKDISLMEGEKSRIRFLNLSLSEDKNSVSIIWLSQIGKDGPERYHTILFVRSKNEEWKIKHWHVSW